VPPRLAAACGLLAPLTSTFGCAVGGLVQRDEYSSFDDDISDLGALTASSAWIYNLRKAEAGRAGAVSA
jgi:hypothetical membrane protein